MRAYSVDLRKKIVDAIRHGRPKVEVARIFGVGISSVKRYMKMSQEDGSLDLKKAPGLHPKKRSVGASERDEWLRAAWRTMISTLDTQRLVFVDEMGTNTSLGPIYAYSLQRVAMKLGQAALRFGMLCLTGSTTFPYGSSK